jgi:hypothetical protein
MMQRFRHFLLVLLPALFIALWMLGLSSSEQARAAGTVAACTEGDLDTALSGGGTVTFSVDCATTPITITAMKTISVNTVIDGSGHTVILDGGGTRRLFSINRGITLTLNNITLQNGRESNGAAIRMEDGGIIIIKNSKILNNQATNGHGGAIFADGDPATMTAPRIQIENSLFQGNRSSQNGGAIFIDGGENYLGNPTRIGAYLDIKNSTFDGNYVAGNGNGGAICINYHTTFNMEGSLFTNNQAVDSGGAIFVANPTDSRILNDDITNLANNTFSGNIANTQGDGASGGALSLGGNSNLVQNTFYGNTLNSGGPQNGSAIFWGPDSNGILQVVLRDNIFSANVGGSYDCNKNSSAAPYGNGNLGDDTSCNNGSATSPVTNFDTTLADNGGPTLTHALLTGSNALDSAAACTYASSGVNPLFDDGDPITRDQRGAGRPFNTTCDKGAFEYHETITQGTCTGAELNGPQAFPFSNGRTLTVTVNTANGLNCITVEQMGRAHELGNHNIQLYNNWFHIRGNINSGFDVNLTLPVSNLADDGDLVCRYTGGGTQTTWDCAAVTPANRAQTITRNNVSEFSDWAIFEDDNPTAITLTALRGQPNPPAWSLILVAGLLALTGWVVVRPKR